MNAIQRAKSREIWNALQQREDAEWQKWLDDMMNITHCYNGHRVTWESGLDYGSDESFCPVCHANGYHYVVLGQPKPEPQPRVCNWCEAEMSPDANFCGRCGKHLDIPF